MASYGAIRQRENWTLVTSYGAERVSIHDWLVKASHMLWVVIGESWFARSEEWMALLELLYLPLNTISTIDDL